MFRLNSQVIIEKKGGIRYPFNGIAGCRLETDMSALTGTCTLKLPRKIKWKDGHIPITRDDDVTVRLGYDENLSVRFVGKIKNIGVQSPLELECEDWMYRLKQKPVGNIFQAQLQLTDLLEMLSLSKDNILWKVYKNKSLGAFRWGAGDGRVSVLLDQLKQKQQINSFFRLKDGVPVLYCGEGLTIPMNDRVWEFKRGLNLIKDETKVVEDEENKVKYFTGSFTTFGMPDVTAGDRIFFQPGEEAGAFYQVKKVTVDFMVADENNSGYRQKIELGKKL